MKVAVVGATGMVGEIMLQVLAERNFPVTELIPVASEKSVGKEIPRSRANPFAWHLINKKAFTIFDKKKK